MSELKKEQKGTAHDEESFIEGKLADNLESATDATWGEVFSACCVHSGTEWMWLLFGLTLMLTFVYFFLFGINLLNAAAKIVGGCAAGELLGDETNPVAALMIGIISTAFIQSSSTTTSIVVSLVGADSIGLQQGIYIVMGANIGTSITNTIVALTQMGDGDELERAFAGATIHDLFNFGTVVVLFPIEVFFGYLYHLTRAVTSDPKFNDGGKFTSPLKKIVSPLINKIIKANKNVLKGVAAGGTCDDYYPTICNGTVNYKNCGGDKSRGGRYGLIACDKKSGECPLFFQVGATQKDDEVAGYICLFAGLILLVACLIGLVVVLKKMLLGVSTKVLYKATNLNGYVAILLGTGITMFIQSSSIVTSVLTPLVGINVLRLEQMLPLTLGANCGTTFTALMAALVTDNVNSLRSALAHLFFNVSGILIFYPIPFMRYIPINGAIKLGKATRIWKGFPIAYIITMFLIIPFSLFGISSMFEKGETSSTILGSVIVIILAVIMAYFVVWWRCKGGSEKTITCLNERQARREAYMTLATDMEVLKAKVAELTERSSMSPDEVEPLKVNVAKEDSVEIAAPKKLEDDEIEA